MFSNTPFGNPDGSRSDIKEVVDSFISFDELRFATGLGIRPDDLSVRIIVGAKGSGKTVYLRRLRAAAVANDSVYADSVQQDLPVTSNIVKFCQCFRRRDLTEKWMQLWYCAILRSLATHLLHARSLVSHLSSEHREELLDYGDDLVPRTRREVTVYSQVTEIIGRFHTDQAYSRYFDDPDWAALAATISDVITSMPPIYFFIDSVDEEYASAPMFWLQCQKGLFFRTMRFLRDQHFGGRLHVIACVRDHVLASVLRSEHQNRYRGEPHITTLGWDHDSAAHFLQEKISRLDDQFLIAPDESDSRTVQNWLGSSMILNKGRGMTEPLLQYLLRHTRLLPRDIVIMGNRLCELAQASRRAGKQTLDQAAIRKCIRQVSTSFGNEQLAICANQIASSSMPSDAARMEYDEIYTGDTEYARGIVEQLREVIGLIGQDRFPREDLELAGLRAKELFGEHSDALSVLWQNRLLGYTENSAEGQEEIFFSELNCDHFNLPFNKQEYVLHSCMIDSVGIKGIGDPVGRTPSPEGSHEGTDSSGQAPSHSSVHEVWQDTGAPKGIPKHLGKYPIINLIGRGGMGVVYLAEDPRLKRRIAVKVLPEGLSKDARFLGRFRREARILAALNHPNIATIHSLEEDAGTHFLTMELVVGETLASRLSNGTPSIRPALRMFRQIAKGLMAAHEQGVIHRDLKPQNIMISADDHIKILDFGIAKALVRADTSHTQFDTTTCESFLGTPGYMSPEQLRGEEVDHRSDIWAFGCTLFEGVSGAPAFCGRTSPERIASTLEQEPDWSALHTAPVGIRTLIQQCLVKDVSQRLSSISEVIDGIDGTAPDLMEIAD